jgi:hypothetical protein
VPSGETDISLTLTLARYGSDGTPAPRTTVQAIVTSAAEFKADKKFDLIPPIGPDPAWVVPETQEISNDINNIESSVALDSRSISIPAGAGRNNTFRRPATATLAFPEGSSSEVTRVRLFIVDMNGKELDTVFDEAPGKNVKVTADGRTLKFSLTYPDGARPAEAFVAARPPQVQYKLEVQAMVDGVENARAGSLGVFNTLWSVQDFLQDRPQQFGDFAEILGRSDWAAPETLAWLKDHATLLYGDISGEHGRFIGDFGRRYGNEVDILPFGAAHPDSGADSYQVLEDLARSAARGNVADAAEVAAFIRANREGIDALFKENGTNNEVSSIVFGYGNADPASNAGDGLPRLDVGWLGQAMLSGQIPLQEQPAFDLKLGAWTPAGLVAFDQVNNSHMLVQLRFLDAYVIGR